MNGSNASRREKLAKKTGFGLFAPAFRQGRDGREFLSSQEVCHRFSSVIRSLRTGQNSKSAPSFQDSPLLAIRSNPSVDTAVKGFCRCDSR